MSESEELRVIVDEGDGGFVAICPSYPGLTGEGATRQACVESLQHNIESRIAAAPGPDGSHGV